jgi:glycosyltransferase involved in cell wall biosynthesis
VSSDLYPFVVGGIAIHIDEMSKTQTWLGHDVTVYTSLWNNEPKSEIRNNYSIKRFSGITILRNNISPNMLYALIKNRHRHDIIHAHSHLYASTNIAALVRRLGSSPLVITNHGLISQTVPLWIQKIYLPTIGKWTFKSADRIICYTENEKLKLIRLGIDSEKIVIIHNGIDPNIFSPTKKEKYANQILWIGKFVPGKGAEYLIEAFNILVKEWPDLKLLMIGNGPLKEDIKQKIRELDIGNNIIMKEFVPNSELPETYQNSDVFVLPSLNEGVPRTILEAMACGIPVVCTELPQLVDVVDSCGLLVPVKDSQALAEGISKIMSDRDMSQKFGKNGRVKVVENYSWEDTVKKTVQLYEEVLWQK